MVKSTEVKGIVGLEVGTSKVVAVVGEILADGVINVLGVGSSPSKGIDKGNIQDLDAVVKSIERAIDTAQSFTDVPITNVTLAISGEHITSLNESGFVPIDSGEVTQEDIDRAIYTASKVKISEGLTPLLVIPQEFNVDKQVNIKNPLGLQGVRLTAQVHIIACHQDWMINLIKAVNRSKLTVDNVVFSGLASSYSVLSEDEKELGVCLIDIGGGTMDITVYTDGAIRLNKTIPYAGNRVRDDIVVVCATSREEAEKIKISYCNISNSLQNDNKQIQVAGIGGRAPSIHLKSELSNMAASRYRELFKLVNKELVKLEYELRANHMKSELIAGVVLTGGAAQIEGIVECATEIFNAPVRVGQPINITGLTDYVNKPQYSTALGLIQYNYYSQHISPSGQEKKISPNDGFWNIFMNKTKDFFNKLRSEF